MKKFLIGMLTATVLFLQASITFAETEIQVPEAIYRWVHSTARGNYYFNYRVMGYRIKSDDTLDLNILEVPTICTYDNIQIQDVVQKRRWRMKSILGYNNLIGRADYLEFNLTNETVQIVRRADLDHTFTELDYDTSGTPIKLSELSKQDISYKFYRAILKWAQENNDWIIRRSRGKLSERDAKVNPREFPIFKIRFLGN